MKQKTRWHDALVLAAVLCAAFLIVTGTQQITGRIDGVASMVFVLAVFLISIYTDGYVWGVVASLIGVLAVNFAFRSPYFAFNFTLPENLFSGMAMLVVSIMTSTLTTRIKKQEQLRMESETEKMRATLLRAVSHDLRTPLTSIYGACSTVIENYDSLEKEQKLKLLGEACSDAQWLNRMVENLLSVTRFDGGQVAVQKTPTVLDELIDRYGSPPKSVQGLVDVSLVRVTAARVGIAEIVQRGDQLILYSDIVGPKQLGEVMEKFPHRVLYNALGRPYFSLRVQKGESPLVLLRDVVTLLPGAQNQPQTKP